MSNITFRYLKFSISAIKTNSVGSTQISEFNVLLDSTRINFTLASATTNGTQFGDGNPNNALDNSLSTKYGTTMGLGSDFAADGPAILTINFGQSVTANQYQIGTADDIEGRDPKSWTASVSTDNSSYTTVDTRTNYTLPPDRQSYDSVLNFTTMCFHGDTKVLMYNNEMKKIKDIVRNDVVITDKENNTTNIVANIYKSHYKKAVSIPKKLIGNTDDIICSLKHPIWIHKWNKNFRVCAENIVGRKIIEANDYFYNIQFEDEGTYYVENVRVDSLSPNFSQAKLPKEMYFDQSKYDANFVVKGQTDKKRNKPLLLDLYDQTCK